MINNNFANCVNLIFFKNVFSNKFQIMLCKSVELIFLTNTVKLSYFFPIHCIKKH